MHFLVEIFPFFKWYVIGIRVPCLHVFADVFPDSFQFLTVSNDMIMIIPLPQTAESVIRIRGGKYFSTSTV